MIHPLARVTDADVKGIVDTTVDTTPFINSAHVIVEEELYPLGVLTEDRLTQIELYLAAHFLGALEPHIIQEKIGDAVNTYARQASLGLDSTPYGQQAKLLDSTGTLIDLERPKAKMTLAGSQGQATGGGTW